MSRAQVHTTRTTPHAPAPRLVLANAPVDLGALTLRPLTESDRPEFLRVLKLSRPSVEPYVPLNEPEESNDAYFERLLHWTAMGDQNASAARRVITTPTNRILGCVNLIQITRGLAWQADINAWTAADARQQGVALWAINQITDHALAPWPTGLGLHAIHGGIAPQNKASQRVATLAGFKRDPNLDSHLKINGQWIQHQGWIKRAPESAP